jgi:DNA polymerase (family 10)
MENPLVDIISHPTGRLLKKREEYDISLDKILEAARATRTVLEINAYPERLDLNDLNIRVCKNMGIKMVINTDTHQVDQLWLMPFGIAQARRGWAEKQDIANAWPVAKLLKMLK